MPLHALTVIPERTVTFSLIWKKNFGPLGINFFTLAQVKHFCRGVTVVAPVLKTSLCSGFWCSDTSPCSLLMTFSQVLGSLFMRNLSKLCLFLVPLHLCWIKLQTINNMLFEFWMQSDSLGFFLFLSPYKFITSVLTLMKNIMIIISDCSTITKWLQWLVRWCKVIVEILVKIVSG